MGPPQFLAGLLLLCFLGQCAALSSTIDTVGILQPGLFTHPRTPSAPMVGIIAGAAITFGRMIGQGHTPVFWAKLAFIATGLLLGASIWYVARRLYGNAGGIAALLLYCFSPMAFVAVDVNPIPVAALGMFGVVFVSIAVSHTLYARPRGSIWGEIRQRWRRVAMLGIAITLMVGSAPQLTFMVLVAFGFMLYLVPHRRVDAVGLMLAALAIGAAILLVIAGPRWFAQADFFPIHLWVLPHYRSWTGTTFVLVAIAVLAVVTYLLVPRSRYFGNSAPLLTVALTSLFWTPALRYSAVGMFPAWSLPLLFVFVGGIFADLLETEWRRPAVVIFVVLAASLATLELLTVAQHQPLRPY